VLKVKLVVKEGARVGQEIPISRDQFVIGRGEDCHLRPASDLISRRHCAIAIRDQAVVVEEFGSKNGTFLNDERVEGQRQARSGDRLKVGPLVFEMQIVETLGGQKKPKVKDVQEAAQRAAEGLNTAQSREHDIASWLEEDASVPSRSAPLRDTRRLALSAEDTVAGSAALVDTQRSSEASDVVPVDPKSADKKLPGKLPPPPKSANSHDAAAEMLRRMRKPSG
jgi:pSer/pThr/pTyr-binding forkhead associated (FHA) protein